jgi:site-specific recombinase XerD
MAFVDLLSAYHADMVGRSAAHRTIRDHLDTARRLHRRIHLFEPGYESRLQQWYHELQQQFTDGHVGDAKVRNDLNVLDQLFDVAREQGVVASNPVRELRWPGRKSNQPKRKRWLPRPISMDAVRRLLAEAAVDWEHPDPTTVRDRAMLECWFNGLRRIEVCRLRVTDVTYDSDQETLVLRVLGKGNKIGDVPLHPDAANSVALHIVMQHAPGDWRAWWAAQGNARSAFGEPLGLLLTMYRVLRERVSDPVPLFQHRGKAFSPREANRMFARYRDQAGLSSTIGPHQLRHTCGTELLENDVDIRVVQELLRHSNITTTMLYTEVRKGPKARAMRRLPHAGGVGGGS